MARTKSNKPKAYPLEGFKSTRKITADEAGKGNKSTFPEDLFPTVTTEGGQKAGLMPEERNVVIPSRFLLLINAAGHEFVGTFFFILTANLTIGIWGVGTSQAVLLGGLTIGLSFMVIRACFGDYSGGHYNPAVTFGTWEGYMFSKNIDGEFFTNGINKLGWGTMYMCAYIIMQLAASIAASGANNFFIELGGNTLGLPVVNTTNSNTGRAFLLTIFLSWVLVFCYFRFSMDKREKSLGLGTVFMGLWYSAAYFANAAIGGGTINLARWFGPAVILGTSGQWEEIWIPLAGTAVGATAAWVHYELIRNFALPSNSYVGWIPDLMGQKTETVFAHFIQDKAIKKKGSMLIRM